jgi:hypothetical protein
LRTVSTGDGKAIQNIQTDEPVRGSDMIKELSSSLVAIICGAIWLSAIDRVDAKGKDQTSLFLTRYARPFCNMQFGFSEPNVLINGKLIISTERRVPQ